TGGDAWIRPELCEEALRLGRVLAGLLPKEPEVWGLVALMEIQASRLRARVGPSGEPILLGDQDRGRWDQLLIRRGLAALERAEKLGGALGPYALQAAIAACHASACPGGDGLGTHRGALRRARRARAVTRRGAESRGRGRLARPGEVSSDRRSATWCRGRSRRCSGHGCGTCPCRWPRALVEPLWRSNRHARKIRESRLIDRQHHPIAGQCGRGDDEV